MQREKHEVHSQTYVFTNSSTSPTTHPTRRRKGCNLTDVQIGATENSHLQIATAVPPLYNKRLPHPVNTGQAAFTYSSSQRITPKNRR